MEDGSNGGDPVTFGVCSECREAYPVHPTEDGWHPVGTDGRCRCGNTEFVPHEEAENGESESE